MYEKKLESILNDIEDKNVELAGGSVVGINIAIINSLIKYIANLTLGKKKYENVQENIKEILEKADYLKKVGLKVIDADKEVLDELLLSYKKRKEDNETYIKCCKKSSEFCLEVAKLSYETLVLADDVSKVGNKMLASDFKICKYYSYASLKSSIVNININLQDIVDNDYKKEIKNIYENLLENADLIINKIS